MKNKNIYIILAIAAGYYFYFNKKKKNKSTVIVDNFLPLQGNKSELLKEEKYIYPGELATVPTAPKFRKLPGVEKKINTIQNKIFATVNKKVKVKKTQSKKSRNQKLGELGALYL